MTRLTLETTGDRQVTVTRAFAAPPDAVFRAHTEAELIRRWMVGPDGWSMPVCEIDARPGGDFRYGYEDADGGRWFEITGTYRALDRPGRIEHVERMHMPDPTPENEIVTTFEPKDGGTWMTMTMTLPDAATREAMLATGMEGGMEMSYAQLDRVVGAG